jgi:hypothetical protein
MISAPEKYRLTNRNFPFATDASYGNNGIFNIPHHRIKDYYYSCVISDGKSDGGLPSKYEGWEHVSVTLRDSSSATAGLRMVKRCPTWEEMCYVKDLFWGKDEAVMQLHPPAAMHVNNHPFCLHLWRKDGIPLPAPEMVGIVTGR